MRAWGRLLRLSLAPSAAADVACGLVLGTGGAWPEGPGPWLLIVASLAIYAGNMALNDWRDAPADAGLRAERPLVTGEIRPGAALAAGAVLQVLGIAAAGLAAPATGLWMAAVSALAVSYNLGMRGPLLGPSLLAACRAGNLGCGLAFAAAATGHTPAPVAVIPAGIYAAYVFFVSRLGRLEDGADSAPLGSRPRSLLLSCAACLVLVPLLSAQPTRPGTLAAAALAWPAAFSIARFERGLEVWTRAAVLRAMGGVLRRLLIFTAACTLLAPAGGATPWIVAGAILLGFPIAFALRRVFPPS